MLGFLKARPPIFSRGEEGVAPREKRAAAERGRDPQL